MLRHRSTSTPARGALLAPLLLVVLQAVSSSPALARWPEVIGGSQDDTIHKMVTDEAGNVYVIGEFRGSGVFGTESLESVGASDAYVVKYDANGNSLWASRGGGSGNDGATAIALDAAGTPYVAGFFSRRATFEGGAIMGGFGKQLPVSDPTTGGEVPEDELSEVFVARLDPDDGDWDWVTQVSDIGSADEALAITYLPGAGPTPVDSVVVGVKSLCPRFHAEEDVTGVQVIPSCGLGLQIALLGIDTLGGFNWGFSGAGSTGSNEWITGLDRNAAGEIFASGVFTSTIDVGSSSIVWDPPGGGGGGANPVLSFDHLLDDGNDGGAVLEYSTNNGGSWYDILAGDGSSVPADSSRFISGGYNGFLFLSARQGWIGNFGRSTVQVDLTDFVGTSVRFRWRFLPNPIFIFSPLNAEWIVDDIEVSRGGETLYREDFSDEAGASLLQQGWTVDDNCSSCGTFDNQFFAELNSYLFFFYGDSKLTMRNSVPISAGVNHFIAKLEGAAEGTPSWSWAKDLSPDLSLEDMVAGPGTNRLTVIGTASASTTAPLIGSPGAYVAELDLTTGSPPLWGSSAALGGGRGNALALGAGGRIYVTGTYGGSAGGVPFPGVVAPGLPLPTPADEDVFIASLASFAVDWAASGGDPSSSNPGPDRGLAIAASSASGLPQVYAGGEFTETASFANQQQTLSAPGNVNVFVHNLDGVTGEWFFLALQTFFAGGVVTPPSDAWVTGASAEDDLFTRPVWEVDAPGDPADYFLFSPPTANEGIGRLHVLQPVEGRILWKRIPRNPDGSVRDPDGDGFPDADPTNPPAADLEQLVRTEWPAFVNAAGVRQPHYCSQANAELDTSGPTPVPTVDEDGDGLPDPCRQIHVAGAPVDLNVPATGLAYAMPVNVQATQTSGGSVSPSRVFTAASTGFSVLVFAEDPADPNIAAHPAFVQVIETLEASSVSGFIPNHACTIGREIDGTAIDGTDFRHDDLPGRNGFVASSLAFYDPDLYDPTNRTGQIVPVNEVNRLTSNGEDEMVVVWSRRSFRLSNDLNLVGGIPFPELPVRYDCRWPADPDKIIIASQTGSEVLGQPVLDPALFPLAQIYNQDDPTLPGFNPNDEHAFLAPSNLGSGFDAVFAIRNDFALTSDSTDPSKPFTLLKYFDEASQKWLFQVYEVMDKGAGFAGFDFPGTAGTKVSAPYPVSLLGNCSETAGSGTAFFQDYSGAVWAKARGSMRVRFWYPLQPTFFWPRDTTGPSGIPDGVPEGTGECVPWLDRLPETPPLQPIPVDYNIVWPDDVPTLFVGETLLKPKRGLPNIVDQAAAQVIFDEIDPNEASPLVALAQLIDPLSSRTVTLRDVSAAPDADGNLPLVPLTSKVATQLEPESGNAFLVSNEDGTIRLPASLRQRIFYDPINLTLSFRGVLDQRGVGEPLLLLNIMSPGERDLLVSLAPGEDDYVQAIQRLYILTRNPQMVDRNGDCQVDDAFLVSLQDECEGAQCDDDLGFETAPEKACEEPFVGAAAEEKKPGDLIQRRLSFGGVSESVFARRGDGVPESLAVLGFKPGLTAGLANGTGFVTLAFNNDASLAPLPVSLNVLRVDCVEIPATPEPVLSTYQGEIKVIESDNVFDEQITLRHTGDFAGDPSQITFEWFSHPDVDGTPPVPIPDPDNGQLHGWLQFPVNPQGANEITIQGANFQTLSDNWYVVRYKGLNACGNDTDFSVFAGQPGSTPVDVRAQLAPGWVKRVISGLNPFEARVKDFHAAPTNTFASMISQLGQRYEGDIAFNPDAGNLNSIGLIEAYETVLRRAMDLSIGGTPPLNFAPANNALLLVASRIADFYILLGNEAWADSQDPMIGFGTSSGAFGSLAPTIFTFQNQLESTLEEEVVLLRGRDDAQGPVRAPPVYNRLFWNFTTGEGEVAYALAYNITDQDGSGVIDEEDGKILFPQGHGDAWGHYLTALTTYYKLLRHPFFTWQPRPEAVLVGGAPIQVDFLDERKFATAAAAKARAGAQIVDLTYRREYVEDPAGQWQGYKDRDEDRAWGLSGWGRRAGQGAYLDWVTANSILPEEDPNPDHVGIQRIERGNIDELDQIGAHFAEIQKHLDTADRGLNPLGLARGVVPFDIDPSLVEAGSGRAQTHFEQILGRAEKALDNAVAVWDHANELNLLLRRNQDDIDDLTRNVLETEFDFTGELISIFGYPYADDIGAGGTYPEGYVGPDVYHWMYVDQSDLTGTPEEPAQIVTAQFSPLSGGVGFFDFDAKPRPECIVAPSGSGCSLSDPPKVTLPVDYSLSTSPNTIGLIKPPSFTGARRATGELQDRLSDFYVALNDYDKTLKEYDDLVASIKGKASTLKTQFNLAKTELILEQSANGQALAFDSVIAGLTGTQVALRRSAVFTKEIGTDMSRCIPDMLIAGFSFGGDTFSAAKCASLSGRSTAALVLDTVADGIEIAKLPLEIAKNQIGVQLSTQVKVLEADFATAGVVSELNALFRQEPILRHEAFEKREIIEQQRGNVLAALARGQRLLKELENFRKFTAADVQQARYQDFTFRVFRNDALRKYRQQFDLAARYAYLAAAAYDYETNFLGSNPKAGQDFLTDIVRERAIGQIVDGQPIAGTPGLADPLARMRQNFDVLKGQLGFNNPQIETNRFSLRRELFRLSDASGVKWSEILDEHRVDNLFDDANFRRFARPFTPPELGAQPGIIIPFSTTVTFGLNFFGWPLGANDSAYDPTNFATKVRGVGVWMKDYDRLPLSDTPRVYLIPVGADVLRAPEALNFETREWVVNDQRLPVPFPVGAEDLDNLEWIPQIDGLSGDLFEIRRFSSFKAHAFSEGDPINATELTTDSRLIGRSVWNTQWLLIIPGGTMLADPDEALDTFIHGQVIPGSEGERDGQGVSDITFFFQTYAFSGN